MADIDCFMAAIRQQESGNNYGAYNPGSGAAGAYQFTPSTWRSAVTGAGLGQYAGTSANRAPSWVQDAAARWLMGGYYAQWGSWTSVAEAWYGGPGAVGHPGWSGGPGYPTVGQYAASVIAIMNRICGGSQPGPAPTPPAAPYRPGPGALATFASWNVAVSQFGNGLPAWGRAVAVTGQW